MKDDRLYLIYIQECIDRVEKYTVNGKSEFHEDIKTQDAVLRNLHTIAESVQRLSPDLLKQYSETDWGAIMAFRNVVVHDYLGIDLDEIWLIVEQDLPELKDTILRMLKTLE